MKFIVRDERGVEVSDCATEIAGRMALEENFMKYRNHNFYLFRLKKGQWTEIGRRINSNRFGGPRAVSLTV